MKDPVCVRAAVEAQQPAARPTQPLAEPSAFEYVSLLSKERKAWDLPVHWNKHTKNQLWAANAST